MAAPTETSDLSTLANATLTEGTLLTTDFLGIWRGSAGSQVVDEITVEDLIDYIEANAAFVDTSGTPVANDIARFTDADTIEGRSYAELKADLDLEIGTDVLAEQTIGIADDNLLEVDGSPNSAEYARFTAAGLEGRTEAEFKADFNLEIGTDVQAWDADLDTLATDFTTASASGAASLAFAEDTDNGSASIVVQGPADVTGTGDKVQVLQDATGTVALTSDLFAVDGVLEDLDTLGANSADGEFIVGTAAGTLAWESGATAFASIASAGGVAGGNIDMNGNSVIFDADGDTYIISNSDDQFDLYAGGGNFATLAGYGFNLWSCPLAMNNNAVIMDADQDSSIFSTTDDVIEFVTGSSARLQMTNTEMRIYVPLYITEQAAASADVAGEGQVWVLNTAPNALSFTDDAGTDYRVMGSLGPKLPTYTVAGAPSASTAGAGSVIYVSNGAAGTPVIAFSDGTNWKRSDSPSTTISAT